MYVLIQIYKNMKKATYTIFLSLFLFYGSVYAQNYFPSSGNVGIGITSPNAFLDIYKSSTYSYPLLELSYPWDKTELVRVLRGTTRMLTFGNGGGSYSHGTMSFFRSGISAPRLQISASPLIPTLEIDYSYSSASGNIALMYTGSISGGLGTGIVGVGSFINGNTSQYVYGVVGDVGSVKGSYTSAGIFGDANNGSSVQYSGYFKGKVATEGQFVEISDGKFKSNISKLDTGMINQIKKLKPKKYTKFESDDFDFGFLAEEVESVFPELVVHGKLLPNPNDSTGSKVEDALMLNYNGLIPVLVQGMQEQSAMIEDLQSQLIKLNQINGINSVVSSGAENGRILAISPNPTKNNTTTIYFEINNGSDVMIRLTDTGGNEVKSYEIYDLGLGKLDIEFLGLDDNSIYIVSLIIDNQNVQSERILYGN